MLNFNISIDILKEPKLRIYNLIFKKYKDVFEDILKNINDNKIRKTTNTTQDEVVKGLQNGKIKYDKKKNKFYGRIIGQALIDIKNKGAELDRRDGKYKLDFNKLNKSWQETIDFLIKKQKYNKNILKDINNSILKIKLKDYQKIIITQMNNVFNLMIKHLKLTPKEANKNEFEKQYKESIKNNYEDFYKSLSAIMRNKENSIKNGAILNKIDYKIYCNSLFEESKKYVNAVLRELFFDNLKDMCEENDTEGFYWYYEWPLTTERPCLEHLKNCIDSMKYKKKFKFKDIQKNISGKKWHSILPGYHKGCRCSFASEYKMLPLSYLRAMENYYKKAIKK